MREVAQYLRSPGSGVDATSSFEDFVSHNMATNPPKLPAGVDYIAYAGTDSSGQSNFKNAKAYSVSKGGGAAIIGDSPWGNFIEDPAHNADLQVMGDKLERYMSKEGIAPLRQDYKGALRDVMWNAGSEPFMSNAIQSGRPVVGFVENATANRGFTNFELTTALKSPETVFNGYPMSAVTGDPVAFASKSATEFHQVENDLANAATSNSGRTVSVSDIRANMDMAGGYDAVNKTMFGQPLHEFNQLNLDQMSAASKAWSAQEAARMAKASPTEPAEHARSPVMEHRAPRGPPGAENIHPSQVDAAAHARNALDVEAGAAGKVGPGIAAKGLGYAGAAAVVYDGVKTYGHTSDLLRAGNVTGGQSEVLHFAGRNLGMLAGAEVVGGAAALAGVESGPGLFVFGAVGAVAGAVGGDKVANAIDNHRIYNQDDSHGKSWHYDPAHPQQGWTRTETVMKTAPDGAPYFEREQRSADAALTNTLNYKASSTAVDLALAHTNTPKDPYSQPAASNDTQSVRDAAWVRDSQSHVWSRQVTDQVLEHGLTSSHTEIASPARTAQLEQSAHATIAANLADSPKGIAQHYLDAYQHNGWQSQGPVPGSVTHALKQPDNVREASDGDTYTRGADGHWRTPGMLYGTNEAAGNIRDELNATQLASQQHAGGATTEEAAAAPHAPTASLSRTMDLKGLDEHARAQASMHGGDAAAQNQAAKIASDAQKVERPGEHQPEHEAAEQAQARQDALRAHSNLTQANVREHQVDKAAHADAVAHHLANAQQAAQAHVADHGPAVADAARQEAQQQQAQVQQEREASSRQEAQARQSERQRDQAHQNTRDRHEQQDRQHQERQEATGKAAESTHHADKPGDQAQAAHSPVSEHSSAPGPGHPSVLAEAAAQAVRSPGTPEAHTQPSVADAHKAEQPRPDAHPQEADREIGQGHATVPPEPGAHHAAEPMATGVPKQEKPESAAEPEAAKPDYAPDQAQASTHALAQEAAHAPSVPESSKEPHAPQEPEPPAAPMPEHASAASGRDPEDRSASVTRPEEGTPPSAAAHAGLDGRQPIEAFEPAQPGLDIGAADKRISSGAGGQESAALAIGGSQRNPFGHGEAMEDQGIADLWQALQSKDGHAIDQACDRLAQRPEAQALLKEADNLLVAQQTQQAKDAVAWGGAEAAQTQVAQMPEHMQQEASVRMMTLTHPQMEPPGGRGAPSGAGGGGGGGGV